MKKVFQTAVLSLIVMLLSGCAISRNNDRSFWEMIQHFEKSGVHVESVNPLDTRQIKAARAYAFTIGERQIGVYKYDSNNEKHKERLLRVDETGYFYVVGIRYNAIRNGSYVLIDFEKHPRKNDIVNAFKTF
ncbi:MAG: hypothetical protein E7040_09320 [Lentisphaerae bacterium]|nr:hypothetical protein [Lentisphaerota bacterium]